MGEIKEEGKKMMNRLFGKPKHEGSALQTLDKLNEVSIRYFSHHFLFFFLYVLRLIDQKDSDFDE